jgi:hypothetical protein
MRSPRTITLFEEHPELRRPPVSLAASILIHGGAIALVAFAVLYTPRIDTRSTSRYMLRQLDLKMPDQQVHRTSPAGISYPGPLAPDHTVASAGKQSSQSLVLPPIPDVHHGPQTLVQPDVKSDVILTQVTPVPQVVLWTPASHPVAKIVAPPPLKPPSTNVRPTLEKPNPEPRLSDIALSSSDQPSLKSIIVPSTTTPVVVKTPQPQPVSPPATVSQAAAKPAPAAVVSLSDVKMKNGTVALPPVNESAASDAAGVVSLTPGQAKTPSLPGAGSPGNKSPVSGPGNSAGNTPTSSAGNGKTATAQNSSGSNTAHAAPANTPSGSGQTPGPGPGSGAQTQGADAGTNFGDQANTTVISLSPTGQFGSVIIGSSVEDQYPEITDVWKGRMAYTVYLHVGLQKNWILQYSLPRTADAGEGGNIAHLDAPWPYTIVRPNLPTDAIDADALMIHGFVDGNGKFETLSVVFPAQFAQAGFVLDSLQRWQFRPALQNGKVARVEILIIIPEEFD